METNVLIEPAKADKEQRSHHGHDRREDCAHEECGSCRCEEKLSEESDKDDIKKDVIKIILSGALFIAALFLHGVPRYALLAAAYLIVGAEIIISAATELFKEHSIDEEFLMSIATVGAWAIGEGTEAVAVMLFYTVGELLEDIACERSRKSVTALLKLRPDQVTLKKDGVPVKVPLEEAAAGDIAMFSPGERIALDGIIISGETLIDNSALTGESLPERRSEGDNVYGGGINTTGAIEVKITKPYSESSSARILEMVENAQEKKATAERFITRFAKKYTVAVVILALAIAFVIPIFTGYSDTFTKWFYRGLTLLVVSCPCAFVISVPLSFFAGIGCASRNGILVKGASSIESAAKLSAVALDKTGTVTQGNLSVVSCSGGDEILKLAALAESRSTHPIAKAIVKAGNITDTSSVSDITEEAGRGVTANINGDKVFVGKAEGTGAGISVAVIINGETAGEIVLKDELKPDSREAVAELKRIGLDRVVMLSGDKKTAAEETAELVGISNVRAELSPEQKCKELESIKSSTGLTAFVGDGLNDAPVLAASDVGIAMGGLGSDAAI